MNLLAAVLSLIAVGGLAGATFLFDADHPVWAMVVGLPAFVVWMYAMLTPWRSS